MFAMLRILTIYDYFPVCINAFKRKQLRTVAQHGQSTREGSNPSSPTIFNPPQSLLGD